MVLLYFHVLDHVNSCKPATGRFFKTHMPQSEIFGKFMKKIPQVLNFLVILNLWQQSAWNLRKRVTEVICHLPSIILCHLEYMHWSLLSNTMLVNKWCFFYCCYSHCSYFKWVWKSFIREVLDYKIMIQKQWS